MDEGELAIHCFGFRPKHPSKARKRDPCACRTSGAHAAGASKSGSIGCGESAASAGSTRAIRATNIDAEGRTIGYHRSGGRKCERSVLDSALVAVQPGGEQR